MPTVYLSPVGGAAAQFFDNNGVPLAGGKLYTYQAGTTTPQATYTTSTGTVACTNPIILDSAARVPSGGEIWLIDGLIYKFILKDANDVLIATYDNVSGINSVDASQVTYTPPGTGAVVTNVKLKLDEIVNRVDYNSDANFNAAKGNKPNIDGSDNFDAKVTPAGESSQINLSEAVLTVATSNRSAVRYKTSTSISMNSPRHILMAGFRFFGQYSKARAPVFTSATGGQQTVSLTTDLGAESSAHLDGWYAIFACANDGDATPSFKLMPCLRAGTVVGSQITLCSAAEGIHSNTATTYAWNSVNNLNDVDCLVINETVDGRPNAFSGRVTTISANTSTTVTLATIGSVGTFDWLLPAPPGFDHYCYLGVFYYEAPGDVRNIADSGLLVKAKMINNADPNWSATGQIGTISSPVSIGFGGYISPLATGVVVKEVASFSTASLGSYASYFDIDGSQHVVQTNYGQKEGIPTDTMVFDGITIPFCFGQAFYYSNDGSLIASRSGGTLEITGWYEL